MQYLSLLKVPNFLTSGPVQFLGTTSDLYPNVPPLANTKKMSAQVIEKALATMLERQEKFSRTGGSHASALFSLDGTLLAIQEDIGRHNAIDKVIGESMIGLLDSIATPEIFVVSGRISFEIVVKCLCAKIPFLCAVSAPSSLAINYCQEKSITLAGFCRGTRATIYSHAENVRP